MKKSGFMNLCDFLQKRQWRRCSGFAELFVDCGWCFSLNLQPLTEPLCKGCVLNHNKWPHVVQRVGFLSESLYSTLMLFLLVLWLHSTHTHMCFTLPPVGERFISQLQVENSSSALLCKFSMRGCQERIRFDVNSMQLVWYLINKSLLNFSVITLKWLFI